MDTLRNKKAHHADLRRRIPFRDLSTYMLQVLDRYVKEEALECGSSELYFELMRSLDGGEINNTFVSSELRDMFIRAMDPGPR